MTDRATDKNTPPFVGAQFKKWFILYAFFIIFHVQIWDLIFETLIYNFERIKQVLWLFENM